MTIAKWAERYTKRYGWSLVPIEPGRKFPRGKDWGKNTLDNPLTAGGFYAGRPDWNVGLALGPSRMCSLDVDHHDHFMVICDAFNVDLEQLIKDHPTIKGRGIRIMFRVPEGITLPYVKLNWRPESDPTGEKHRELSAQAREKKKQAEAAATEAERDRLLEEEKELRELARPYAMHTVFELRAADDRHQRQDVLPPSMHPDTGRPYEWITEPADEIPEPPAWLLDVWQKFETTYKQQFMAACPWADIEQVYKSEASKPVRPREYSSDGGLIAVANEYARTTPIQDELGRQGYKITRDGRRALSPYSSTGLPGVVIFRDSNKCWIHHASDPLCSDANLQPVSSFDLYCEYEHGGKFVEAARAIAEKMGVRADTPSRNPVPASSGAGQLPDDAFHPAQPDNTSAACNGFNIADPLIWTNDKGKPLAHHDNLAEILRRMGGVIRYNVMRKEEELIFPGQSFSVDNEANASLAYLVSQCSLFNFPTDKLQEFLTYLADDNHYSPVVEWVKSKPWDGKDRLPELYATVRTSGDNDLKNTLIKRWMISAVAAAFSPDGVAAHGVLVFQGDQNLGKTSWFKSLVPAGINRTSRMLQDGILLKPDDKDSVKQACSHWLVELGEIDSSFRKSDHAQLKAFITRDQDTMRRPYARKESTYARRTVFFGSVNPREYLIDDTGNRRFWTIGCEWINSRHEINMQQVWAQIHALWMNGDSHWLTGDEMQQLNEVNESYGVICPVEERIMAGFEWDAPTARWEWMSATEAALLAGIDRPTRGDASKAGAVIAKMNGGQRKHGGAKGRLLLVPPRVTHPF